MITGILENAKPNANANFENKLQVSEGKNFQQYSDELVRKFLARNSATKASYLPRFEIVVADRIETGAIADNVIPKEEEKILHEKHRLILEKKYNLKQNLTPIEVEFLDRMSEYMENKYFLNESKKVTQLKRENNQFIEYIDQRLRMLED